MKCKKHKEGLIVLHAFSEGYCKKCKKEIRSSHTPCDKVCEKCSEKHSLCIVCGDAAT